MSKPRTKPADRDKTSTLVNRNVTIGGRRTSIRLEPIMWDTLDEICHREAVTRNQLCETIYKFKHASTLTAGVRVFVINYYRAAATAKGHASVGHGAMFRRGSQLARS